MTNIIYMQTLKIDEVPWRRLTTAYGRATEFPKYFKIISDMSDCTAVKDALNEITGNIEHQETLWHSTPFAMIFLVRIFEKAVSEINKNETANFLIEKLLIFLLLSPNVFIMAMIWNMNNSFHFFLICSKKNTYGQRNIMKKMMKIVTLKVMYFQMIYFTAFIITHIRHCYIANLF